MILLFIIGVIIGILIQKKDYYNNNFIIKNNLNKILPTLIKDVKYKLDHCNKYKKYYITIEITNEAIEKGII